MKVKKINIIYLISIILLASLLFAFLPININKISKAEETKQGEMTLANGIFSIDVIGRDGKLLFDTPGSFNNETAHIYDWKNAEKFIFNINTSGYNPPVKYDEEKQPYYDVSIIIDYVNGYKESAVWESDHRVHFEELGNFKTTVRGVDSHLTLSTKFKPVFEIDKGVLSTESGTTKSAKEWGIYKFTLSINGALTESDFIIIEPTTIIYNAPQTKMKPTTSDTSLRTAYFFTLENEEEYRYIDKSKLVWHAKGKTQDGKTYAYSKADTERPDFSGLPFLYDNPNQTGLTFKFDDNGKYGKWEIWCEYQAENSSIIHTSQITKIETKVKISYLYIILISVGVVILAVGITVGIGFYRKKKEKVY